MTNNTSNGNPMEVYIQCCKRDLHLLRICVASVRYWYPNISIYLIRDYTHGAFDTREVENNWNVLVLSINKKKLGLGFPKFEVIFSDISKRVFFIDADIVFIGKVIDKLENATEDFIVDADPVDNPYTDYMKETYFDLAAIESFDQEYAFPGFCFNTGQIVATTGKIKHRDFEPFIEWAEPPVVKNPEVFSCADQGLLNYVLVKKQRRNELSLRALKFMLWSESQSTKEVELESIKNRQGYPVLIHWAGTKPPFISKMNRYDILKFFENYYYSNIQFGWFKQRQRAFFKYVRISMKQLLYKCVRPVLSLLRFPSELAGQHLRSIGKGARQN
jgi:lipopolysaccharide biosynthesis glycosyltransferase